MAYKYITENNLYNKQKYMYSEYGGVEFLKEYMDSRLQYLDEHEKLKNAMAEHEGEVIGLSKAAQDLLNIKRNLKAGKRNNKVIDMVNAYTKSFEVRKRIYKEYDNDWKPIGSKEFEEYEAYLTFAECLALSYEMTKCLKYFSCMLKVDDTLLSVQDKLDVRTKGVLRQIIKKELDFFNELAEQNGLSLGE